MTRDKKAKRAAREAAAAQGISYTAARRAISDAEVLAAPCTCKDFDRFGHDGTCPRHS